MLEMTRPCIHGRYHLTLDAIENTAALNPVVPAEYAGGGGGGGSTQSSKKPCLSSIEVVTAATAAYDTDNT